MWIVMGRWNNKTKDNDEPSRRMKTAKQLWKNNQVFIAMPEDIIY